MTTDFAYILLVVAVCAAITFALRAVPFLILKPLRESQFVGKMAMWMPAGILAILTASTFRSNAIDLKTLTFGLIAVAITVVAHLLGGRRTLLSVGAGTIVFVGLVNLF